MAYHYSYSYGYPPAPYAPQQPVGYSDGGYRAECQHCHKLGHPSDKCWLLDQNAHRRPSHWRQPRDGPSQGQSSSAGGGGGGAGYSGMDLDQSTASKMAAMREVRDRIDSSNSSRRSRSPQGARSPRSPHGGARSPTHPHASRFDAGPSSSFSSSSRRPDPRANGAGPSRDSGWNTATNRRPANANEESRSPRHATATTTNAADPRLRGGRKRTFEEGEITSPTRTGGSNSGDRSSERPAAPRPPPPGLPPRPPVDVTTHDTGKASPRSDDDSEGFSLQQRLLDKYEVVDKRTNSFMAFTDSPWPQQPYSRKQNAATMLKSTRRYIHLAEELESKEADLRDAEEWVKNNREEEKEMIATFEKDVRAQMQKDIDETRTEKDKAYEEFAENLSQVTDYHWLIEVSDKKAVKRILTLAKAMQDEYRLAFRKLRADFQDIERASRDGSQTLPSQAAPLPQPTQGAVEESTATAPAAASAPPAASSSSLVAAPSSSSIGQSAEPATSSTSAAPASTPTPTSDATADHVRRLSKAITAIRRRLDHLEENTNEAVEDTHAMQGEMNDNLRWIIREAIKEEKAQHKAKKRKIDEANEDDDAAAAENEAGGQTAQAASGSGAGSVAAPRDAQAMDVSNGEVNGASAPISSSTIASVPAEPAAQPSIDLDALTEALLPRVQSHYQPVMDNFRLEAEQLAEQKVDEKFKLMENRVQDAFKAVEGEFFKIRSEQERRFDFITQEMERRENEYKARIAEFEAKQRESAETIAKLSSHAEMVDKVFTSWTPIIRFAHNAMQASASRPNTPAQPQQQQMPGSSQVRPLQQAASPTMPSHPSNGSEHGRSHSISADAQFNSQAGRPPTQVSQQQQQQQLWPQQAVDAHQAEMTRRLLQAQSQTQNQNQLQNHQPAAQPQSAPQPPVRPAQTQARPHLPDADPHVALLDMFNAFFKRRTISFAGIQEPLLSKVVAHARLVIHTNAACLNMGGMTPTIRQGMLSAAEAVITAAGQTPGVRPSHTVAARFISDAATAQQVQQRQNVPVAAQPSPPPAPPREPSPLGYEIVGQSSRAVKGEPAAAIAAEEEVAAGAGGLAAAVTNGSGSGSGGAGHGEEVSSGASTQPNQPQDDPTSARADKEKEQGATQEQDKANHDDEGDEDGVTTPPPPSAVLPVDNNN